MRSARPSLAEKRGLDASSLMGLGAFAFAARLPGLGRSLWYDELFTLRQFAASPGDALLRQVAANNHPPASLIAWAASSVASSEVALRAPFAIAGALAAVALGWAVAAQGGRRAGLVAGAFAAMAPAHVLASQQVRGYALMLLAAAVLLGCFLRVLTARGAPPRAALVGLVLAAALGVWSHATLLAAVLALVPVALLGPKLGQGRRASFTAALGAGGGAVFGLLLLAPVLGRTFKFVRSNVAVEAAHGLAPGPLGLSALVDGLAGHRLLAAGLALLAVVGAVRLLRSERGRVLGATLVAAPLALLLVLALRPLGYGRFALFALPSLLALAACGMLALTRARRVATTVALLVVLLPASLVAGATSGRELQDVRGAARLALARSAELDGAPLVGLGPGGELLGVYAPAVGADPSGEALRAFVAEGRAFVCVVPLPGWLEEDDSSRRLLWSDAFADPVVLPGREHPVLVFATRKPR